MLTKPIQTRLPSLLARGKCTPIPLNRPHAAVHLTRGYASRSRFPDKTPGTGRARERPQKLHNQKTQEARPQTQAGFHPRFEEQPSAEQSPLWEASQRPPASNPREGLQKLLLENNLLVVTRCVSPISVSKARHADMLVSPRQVEMLNIFLGFEQSNRYVICMSHFF